MDEFGMEELREAHSRTGSLPVQEVEELGAGEFVSRKERKVRKGIGFKHDHKTADLA